MSIRLTSSPALLTTARQVAHWRSRFHCLAVNFPNQGNGAQLKSAPNPQAMCVAVNELVYKHGLRGHSPWHSSEPATPSLLAAVARKRKWQWESRQAAADYLKKKFPYSIFADGSFQAYLDYGLQPSQGGGVQLSTSPETEAQVFEAFQGPAEFDASRVRCPVIVAAGDHTEGFHAKLPAVAAQLAADLPNAHFMRYADAHHLLPMQRPDQIAKDVQTFFLDVLAGNNRAARL